MADTLGTADAHGYFISSETVYLPNPVDGLFLLYDLKFHNFIIIPARQTFDNHAQKSITPHS